MWQIIIKKKLWLIKRVNLWRGFYGSVKNELIIIRKNCEIKGTEYDNFVKKWDKFDMAVMLRIGSYGVTLNDKPCDLDVSVDDFYQVKET